MNKHPRIVVFAHVFYHDVWDEIAAKLSETLARPFHLLVTTPHAPDTIARPETPYLVGMDVMPTANRGRDILPFLLALDEAPAFDLGLKLHTKRSPHRADGEGWRRAMIESLLPTGEGAGAVLAAFAGAPDLGIVASQGHLVRLRHRMHGYRHLIDAVADTFGGPLTRRERRHGVFAAGSMFWFRREALDEVGARAVIDLFEEEAGQLDATTAHALERLFALLAARRGYRSVPADALGVSSDRLRHGPARTAPESPYLWQLPPHVMLLHRLAPVARLVPKPLRMKLRMWLMQRDTS